MGNHFRGNIKLTMKLFDALISPILFYASEVWGFVPTAVQENISELYSGPVLTDSVVN